MGYLSLHPMLTQALNYELKLHIQHNTPTTSSFLPWWSGRGVGKRKEPRGVGGSKLHCSKGIDHNCKQLSMWFQIPELSVQIQILGDASTLNPLQNFEDPMRKNRAAGKIT